MKIGIIGMGKMGGAVFKALKNDYEIIGSRKNKEKRELFNKDENKEILIEDNIEVVKQSDIIFLSVKPQILPSVLEEITPFSENKLFISLAAGITLEQLNSKLKSPVVRVMPNIPCTIKEGVMLVCYPNNILQEHKQTVEVMVSSLGSYYEIKEEQLNLITGISGCGPAFIARLMQYFSEAVIKQGLDEKMINEITLKTFLGTAKYLQKTNVSFEELIEQVTSPKGTTLAGREILENSDVKEVIEKTIKRTAQRSEELSKEAKTF
jgi:pyrroline-5-carboxylate reductase